MTNQIQISIDREVYDQLEALMVPPLSDANAVIKELMCHNGQCPTPSKAAVAVKSSGQHFSYEQELERASQGVYDSGGNT